MRLIPSANSEAARAPRHAIQVAFWTKSLSANAPKITGTRKQARVIGVYIENRGNWEQPP